MDGLDQVLKRGDSVAVLKYIRHHRVRLLLTPSRSKFYRSIRRPVLPHAATHTTTPVQIRASTEVVQHGRDFVMKGKGSSLGDEGRRRVLRGQAWRKGGRVSLLSCANHSYLTKRTAWPVYEQIFLAALDLGETLLAEVSDVRERSSPFSCHLSPHLYPLTHTDGAEPFTKTVSG
jgi:hypothetical protein